MLPTSTPGRSTSQDRAINPTLIIFLVVSIWFYLNIFLLVWFRPLPWYLAGAIFCVQVVLIFAMFTPLHDGVHRVASRTRWLNDLILWGTWPVFLNSPIFFKRLHITHHAYTNHPEMDPDHFTASEKLSARWTRSFLLIFYYYWYGFKHYGTGGFWNALTMISSTVGPSIIIGLGLFTEFSQACLLGWILPNLVGIGLLAFANTSWPHHPAQDTSRIGNTRNLYVPRWLQFIMFNQNLHLVHHLKPTIPWYEYEEYWRLNEKKFVQQGAKVASFTDRSDPYSLLPATVREGSAARPARLADLLRYYRDLAFRR
ncbi:MAG: fatty acid desaturase [Bacteriovoracia bacterium]